VCGIISAIRLENEVNAEKPHGLKKEEIIAQRASETTGAMSAAVRKGCGRWAFRIKQK